MVNLQLPNIKGDNEREQLKQMQRYLYQLVEQLQFALDTVGVSESSSPVKSQMPVRVIQSSPVAMMSLDRGLSEDQVTFQAIKPLIIKSADIINAYYEEINKRLESLYVAQSDFGTFVEQNSQVIEATATDVTQRFNNIQVVITDLDTNIGSVRGDLQAVGEAVSYTQRDINNINESIESIDSYVVQIGGSVSELDEEVKAVGESVQTVATDVESLDTSIADVDKSVQAVDKNLWDLDNKFDDAKTGIDTSLGKLSDDLGQLDSGVQDIKENVDGDLKDIKDALSNITHTLIEVNANIKSGLLYFDENEIPVFGLEIGQRNTVNGVEVFNKFARFTSDRLSFYDQNGTEVAYVSDYTLYITHVQIRGSLQEGGYKDFVDASGGILTRWVGRS